MWNCQLTHRQAALCTGCGDLHLPRKVGCLTCAKLSSLFASQQRAEVLPGTELYGARSSAGTRGETLCVLKSFSADGKSTRKMVKTASSEFFGIVLLGDFAQQICSFCELHNREIVFFCFSRAL